MAIWEGSGNVIALDVLRAIAADGVLDAFWRELEPAFGADRVLDHYLSALRERVGRLAEVDADTAGFEARSVAEALAMALQVALLVRHAPALAGAFIRSRIGRGAALYGSLDDAVAADLLIERASDQD
jgi:putative acyl-CoA dehydrogenase